MDCSGDSYRVQTRIILQQPVNGGTPCPDLSQLVPCSLNVSKSFYSIDGNTFTTVNMNLQQGTIRDPINGASYQPNLICTWIITVPLYNVLTILIKSMDIEPARGGYCAFDSLTIRNDNLGGKVLGTLCGNSIPSTIYSSSNTVVLQFVTDASNNYGGFILTYDVSPIPCLYPCTTGDEDCCNKVGTNLVVNSYSQQRVTIFNSAASDYRLFVPDGTLTNYGDLGKIAFNYNQDKNLSSIWYINDRSLFYFDAIINSYRQVVDAPTDGFFTSFRLFNDIHPLYWMAALCKQ